MPRPKSLTHSDIAAAALAVIDRDGLSALSMRTVAAQLGVGTMSLYRYVSEREEIERLLVELVLSKLDPVVPARKSWREQVTTIAERIRETVMTHPAVVPLFMAHRHVSPSVLRCSEELLRALTEAGFRGKQRVIALRMLISYINGALQAQHLAALDGQGTVALGTMGSSDFPLLAETARTALQMDPAKEFSGGLGIVLDGLALKAQR
jgi:AcrR family transcriptional regulator